VSSVFAQLLAINVRSPLRSLTTGQFSKSEIAGFHQFAFCKSSTNPGESWSGTLDYDSMWLNRTTLLLLAVVLLCTSGFSEEKPWREIRSPHFRVITNGNDGAGRHVAREFEQMRAVFASEFPGYRLDSAEPLLILAPEDEYTTKKLLPEFWKHSGPKPAGVYFHAWEQPYALVRLDAVSDKYSRDEFAVVYHEYVHSLLHLNLHWLPTWLDEGLAEFYAYTRFEGNRTYIGAPPKEMGRLSLLRYRPAIPLAKFIDQRGSFTRSEEDTELFYAQSWALTHFLTLGPGMDGGDRLKKFYNAAQQGVDQKKAFQDTFGDFKHVQQDFDDYIHLFAFHAAVIPSPPKVDDKDLLTRSMTVAETEAELSSFYATTKQWKLAREFGESALKNDPKLALAHQDMGFISLQEGKDEEAVREFSQAVKLDNRMYRAQFAKTMMSPIPHATISDDRMAYRLALLEAVQVNPQFAPVYVELAKLYVAQGDPGQALRLALKAEKLEPWRAGYHLLTGQILLRLDRAAEAASDAAYVADRWSSPDRDEAMELWNLVPAGKRPAQGPAEIAERHDVNSAKGIVKSVACGEHGMTMTLEQGGQTLTFRVQQAAGGFSDTLWFGEDHFTPCYHTTGLRAVVQFKPAADKSYTGDVVFFGFRDDLPATPAGATTASPAK
jgi:tetratricopeptide (TPR) repeat protein